LARDLLDQWPFYAAYVISFITIGIVWINHHALMDRVVRTLRVVRADRRRSRGDPMSIHAVRIARDHYLAPERVDAPEPSASRAS
jgi:hypothetical protein